MQHAKVVVSLINCVPRVCNMSGIVLDARGVVIKMRDAGLPSQSY